MSYLDFFHESYKEGIVVIPMKKWRKPSKRGVSFKGWSVTF